jgi:hypothetical protein
VQTRHFSIPRRTISRHAHACRYEYHYTAKYRVAARDSIAAFEVRCSLFDVWGDPMGTLSDTEVEDIAAGQIKEYTPMWMVYSENDASRYYASLCFVARVRAKQGRVVAANMIPILVEAEKFSSSVARSEELCGDSRWT